jgi:transcriptional regulator with XRE-family HTH domain
MNKKDTKQMEQTVNDRVILLKNYLKLGRQDFAAKANISPVTYDNIANGLNINPKTVTQIATGLGIPRDWLVNGGGPMPLPGSLSSTGQDTATDLWQDATYKSQQDQIKTLQDQINTLKDEAKKAWALAQHFAGGTLNFLKPSKEPGPDETGLLEAA